MGENEHSRTRKSGRVQKQLKMWRPPLAAGSLGGIFPGIFEKCFRLTRRDPAKSIFETSRFLSFFKNLDFSKIWIFQKCGTREYGRVPERAKVAPRLLLHAPLAPRRFLQGGGGARAQSRRVFLAGRAARGAARAAR